MFVKEYRRRRTNADQAQREELAATDQLRIDELA